MLNRPSFWLGLFLGAFSAFRLRILISRPHSFLPASLRHLPVDAFTVCDSAGAVIESNAAAQALFGSTCAVLPPLRYSTGQPVPPGQHPLRRASLAQEMVSGSYHLTAADGSSRILDISAQPLPNGKVAALFRDVTAQQERHIQELARQARQTVLQTLRRRLSLTQSTEAIGQAVAEETYALLSAALLSAAPLSAGPDIQVRLYRLDPLADALTCLASAPDDRPKRPKSVSEANPAAVRFDAQIPELWQLYVARKSSQSNLPLISGGVTIGHLSVASAKSILEDAAVHEALEMIASLAALALAGPSAAAQTAALTAQAAAVREITGAIQSGVGYSDLADVVTEAVKRVMHPEVCALSMPIAGKLCIVGKRFEDDLLSPQTVPGDPRLHGKAVRKAWKTQKTVAQAGIINPSLEAGPWRAFAGSTGRHSVTALPLAQKRGVLTVYTSGEMPLPDTQIKFLETIAALVSLSPVTATASEDPAEL